jgi:signal transduction histidine kinase
MKRLTRPSAFSRRLLAATAIFGLFLLLNIALFGWLIFRSLSQREIERVLLETRSDAEMLARQLERRAQRHGEDLYTAIAVERETQTFIDQILKRRDIVRDVVIRDADGVLVYKGQSSESLDAAGLQEDVPRVPPLGAPELRAADPRIDQRTVVRQESFEVPDIEVPIGRFGRLQIGISSGQLSQRVEVLRQDLIGKASVIAAVSLTLLVAAFAFVWLLLRRAQRLETQAAEAERMAYIGTLASGLAHEIRNPLNSLNLNMQMLEEEIDEHGGSAPGGKRLLSITRSEIGRLERLVSDFLAYAKPRPLELEELPAIRLVERVREVLAGEIQQRRARVEVEDASDGAHVRADLAQMTQLLLNLVSNAFAAAQEAGRVPLVRLSAGRQGGSVVLTVADNGAGIPEADLPRIFDVFYSTRKGGTGLGLAIVRRIARAHGGEVEVASTPGEGTTVTVTLPALPAVAPAVEGSPTPARPSPLDPLSLGERGS